MENEKLKKLADQLLDTGKRNRLINFRDTKMSTLEVVHPDVAAVFEKVGGTSSFEVYDPKLSGDDEFTDAFEETEQLADMQGDTDEDAKPKMTRDRYIAIHSARMKKASQVLLYNNIYKPMEALGNIHKKARTILEETGVNSAYLAFGFIHWREDERSDIIYHAPILLAPIVISRETAVSPYYITLTDDDLVVNPTFSYKLEGEYKIKLPEYEDETLAEYLDRVAEAVKPLRWQVTGECKIGIFSFLKMNMYHDLNDHEEIILQNENVRRVLGEPVERDDCGGYGERPEHSGNALIDLHTVVDADSSQIEAIEMAKSGASFVLQGPPGTGKSQTITNIIAECLYDNKKVLFVSEKQAALNVVYDKLKKAGLEEFCLALHSYKANKKDVIAELNHTLNLAKSKVSDRAEAEVAIKEKAQKQLDSYAEELHKICPVINKSLYQLINDHSDTRGVPDIPVSIADIATKGETYLREVSGLLEQYVEYVPSIGYDYRKNTWYGYENRDTSYQANQEVLAQMQRAFSGLERCVGAVRHAEEVYGIRSTTLEDCATLQKLTALLSQTDFITPAFFAEGRAPAIRRLLMQLQETGTEMAALRQELEARFEPKFFLLDGREFHKKLTMLYSSPFTRLFNSDYKALINNLRMTAKTAGGLRYRTAVAVTEKQSRFTELQKEFRSGEEQAAPLFGAAFVGENTDWHRVSAQWEQLETIRSCGLDCTSLANLSAADFEAAQQDFGAMAADLQQGAAEAESALRSIAKLFNPSVFDIPNSPVTTLHTRLGNCIRDIDRVENWNRFAALMDQLRDAGVEPYLTATIEENVKPGDVVKGFRRMFYRQWIETVIRDNDVLRQFTRVAQDKAVETFWEKDVRQFEISKAQIREELSAKRPSLDYITSGSMVQLLRREAEKKRKQRPIRVLLEDIHELAQLLKPCFLMSPLSVSTFLTSDAIRFDTVIFDEASQVFPHDAIGAIYRGKQIIVVGDSKQMPPSNFFSTTVESDENDDTYEEDVADFESILDLCAASLPQLRLNWHYRSRYEQLIAFSNRYFYDNSLVTFPSSQADKTGIGVDYFPVDGLFDHRSHNNRLEAERVVELIFRNADLFPNRSLGVVAFSKAQQALIESLLCKRRWEDPSKEAFFSPNAKEPFFIKNLETVQGDERDTIIFSIAYGRDSQGRVMHNFGPLNREGGERRLNVAVSRAKYNLQVVSTMHSTDIDLKRAKSTGAKLLRAYLDFAEHGISALEKAVEVVEPEQFDSPFEREVYDFLRAKGYQADTQVGCSGYKIDIGLKRPGTSDYVLAIECDGAAYHSSKNARDRDRLRQTILENMGWRFYRIWSTDWFRNRETEKDKLLRVCKDAFLPNEHGFSGTNETPAAETEATGFEEKAKAASLFPEYKTAPNPTCLLDSFQDIILRMLQVEAPLSEEWLLKRVVYLFQREKVTNVVWDEYESIMYRCEAKGILRHDGFLYLKGQEDYVLRVPGERREVKYIAPEELAAGMYTLIKENVTTTRDGLYSRLTDLLGFSRCGEAMRKRYDEALELLKSVIREDDGLLSLR